MHKKYFHYAFLILSVVYLARGLYHFAYVPNGGTDLEKRKRDSTFFLAKKDPYAVYLQCRSDSPPPYLQPLCPEIQAAGYPSAPVYPPWALPILAFVSFHEAWFLLLNAVAVFYLFRSVEVSALAISTMGTNLGVGQLGILLIGLLTGAQTTSRKVLSSFLLSVALLKPHFSLPFLGCFLFGNERKRVWDALTFTAVFWLASSLWLQVSPTHLFAEFFSLLKPSLYKGDSLINLLPRFTWTGEIWAVGMAAFFLGLLYQYRNYPLDVRFAIAAVGARFWTYHAYYDNVLLSFLLLALLSRKMWVPFALVGMTLWLPPSVYAFFDGVTLAEHGIWAGGLFCLLKRPLEERVLGELRSG